LESLQGRHGLAVLELTDKARGDPGTLGEFYCSQSSRLAHTSQLISQIHWPSLTLPVEPGAPAPCARIRAEACIRPHNVGTSLWMTSINIFADIYENNWFFFCNRIA
jgi:hypothetical protein